MPSFIAYRGPSLLNGRPIVLVVVASSRNVKTGNMVQTYIIPDEGQDPVAAAREGRDDSVCGNCPHRPTAGGTCYVTLVHGPLTIWKTLQRQRYATSLEAARTVCAGRMVRLGTYGDPAAVPLHIWETLLSGAQGHTGYTHQWRDADPAYLRLCMASADSPQDAADAHARGYRTFRVRRSDEPLAPREMVCPASQEAGKRLSCSTCGACKGTRSGHNAANVVIIAHGTRSARF